MEIINPFVEQFPDVKICRLCGKDNKENIDIFTSKPISSRSEDLLTKIMTVYPLVLYKNDPLPQHICPKCIGNVSRTYQDIQQVMRQQNKWMGITKAVQPEHKYFHILNMVQNSTKTTKQNIKTAYNIEITNIKLENFFPTTILEIQDTSGIKTTKKDNMNDIVVKNIQNKLESNGFTIKRIKVPSSCHNNNQDCNSIPDATVKHANCVSCSYCKQKFSDLKILAQHQLTHLKLRVNKIFEKQFLAKHLRRGRLITLNDNKCIRCLNCWRIHKDNKAILQHWSEGECEFFCLLCGKEFPHSPKHLREHVTEFHGVSYRGVRNEYMANYSQHTKPLSFTETTMKPTIQYLLPTKLNADVIKKPGHKKPPKSCTKNDDGTITCKICHKVFDNFRSSNSHMRKHKPPNRYTETAVAPSRASDKYNIEDDYAPKPSTSNVSCGNPAATNPLPYKPPRPAYKIIMKNGPLRGIKTKIVQKRHDFLNSHVSNVRHSAPSSMGCIEDKNNDENLIVPELLTSAVKAERMLNNNSYENGRNGIQYAGYSGNSFGQAIKSEPLDNSEYGLVRGQHLCFICNESFSNARDYELHTMFVHNIN